MTESELYQYLNADTGILAVTTRVFNGDLPEKTQLPAVTFRYVSDRPINSLKGDTGHAHSRYTINAWASTYEETQTLKNAIVSAMSSNIRLATVPLHEPKNNLYRIAIDYSLFA